MKGIVSPWFGPSGRLRAPWRALLFVPLFLGVLWLEMLLLPNLSTVPLEAGRLPVALVAQGVLLLAAALLAAWPLLRWVDGRSFASLGFGLGRAVPRQLAVGTALGAAGPVVVVLALATVGAFRFTDQPGTVVGWLQTAGAGLVWLAVPAAAEEAVFRGYPFQALVEGAGPVIATVVMSALFALVHGSNPGVGWFGLVNIFLAGVLLSVAVLRTGSLWFASAVHLGWNWATATGLDLPVSGLDLFDAPFYDGVPSGPAWVTGGGFGPEGGLAGTAAVAVSLGLVGWYTRRAHPSVEPGRLDRGQDR